MDEDLEKICQAAFDAHDDAVRRFSGYVTPSSRPVAWFGDTTAYAQSPIRILTVGLNPSQVEFPADDPDRRFPAAAGAAAASGVYRASLDRYFTVDPYWKWFNTYRPMLEGLEASFANTLAASTAVHSDLCSPVPTSPTWSGLPNAVRAALAARGVELWHDLVRALRPQVVLLSVAHRHLEKIQLPTQEPGWTVLHTIEQPNAPYEVRVRRYDVDDSPVLVVWGRAANTPFGSISYAARWEIGVRIRKEFS